MRKFFLVVSFGLLSWCWLSCGNEGTSNLHTKNFIDVSEFTFAGCTLTYSRCNQLCDLDENYFVIEDPKRCPEPVDRPVPMACYCKN